MSNEREEESGGEEEKEEVRQLSKDDQNIADLQKYFQQNAMVDKKKKRKKKGKKKLGNKESEACFEGDSIPNSNNNSSINTNGVSKREPQPRPRPAPLCRVFHFLDLSNRIAISCVNRRWRDLSTNPASWEKLVIRIKSKQAVGGLLSYVNHKAAPLSLLKELEVEVDVPEYWDQPQHTQGVIDLLHRLISPTLRIATVHGVALGAVLNCGELESLTIRKWNHPSLSTFQKPLSSLKVLKNLRSLSLATQPITEADMLGVRELTSLTHLDLGWTPATDRDLENITELVNLTSLDLTHCAITGQGIASIVQRERRATMEEPLGSPLLTLHLSGSQVGDGGLLRLGRLSSLHTLTLRGVGGITGVGLRALLSHANTLTYLDLGVEGSEGVEEGGLGPVTQLPRLQFLSLSSQPYCNDVIISVGSRSWSSLRTLDLRGCRGLTNNSLDSLANLSNLHALDLRGCPLSSATTGLDSLNQRLPKLTICSDARDDGGDSGSAGSGRGNANNKKAAGNGGTTTTTQPDKQGPKKPPGGWKRLY